MRKEAMVPIGARIPPDLLHKVESEMEQTQWSLSDIVRDALEKRYEED